MEKVPGRFVLSIPASRAPGVFRFFNAATPAGPETAGLIFRCPGCADVTSLGFSRPTRPGAGIWTWDGDRQAPTLHPSVSHALERGGCGWHGHLVRGDWVPC